MVCMLTIPVGDDVGSVLASVVDVDVAVVGSVVGAIIFVNYH